MLLASAAMGVSLILIWYLKADWFAAGGILRLIAAATLVFGGMAIYAAVGILLGAFKAEDFKVLRRG